MRKKYNMINDRSYLLFYLGEMKFSRIIFLSTYDHYWTLLHVEVVDGI